jgi:hypothetical protein
MNHQPCLVQIELIVKRNGNITCINTLRGMWIGRLAQLAFSTNPTLKDKLAFSTSNNNSSGLHLVINTASLLTMAARQALCRCTRRCMSSSTPNRVGTIQPRKLNPSQDPEIDPLLNANSMAVVPRSTVIKNAVTAAVLLSVAFGIGAYSMNTVGQAGGQGEDDPLATLRQEAAVAQERVDRENEATEKTREMLGQFESGAFDPDRYEDVEAEMERAKAKRPWWKVW